MTRAGQMLRELRGHSPHGRSRGSFVSNHQLPWDGETLKALEIGRNLVGENHLEDLVKAKLIDRDSQQYKDFMDAIIYDREYRRSMRSKQKEADYANEEGEEETEKEYDDAVDEDFVNEFAGAGESKGGSGSRPPSLMDIRKWLVLYDNNLRLLDKEIESAARDRQASLTESEWQLIGCLRLTMRCLSDVYDMFEETKRQLDLLTMRLK